jgi:hypothetical protein
LSIISGAGKPAAMAESKLTREERLAAKLRENLRLRKAQARAMGAADARIAKGPRTETDESGTDR